MQSHTHNWSFGWITRKINNKIKYLKVPTYDAALEGAITYLACHAQRAHSKRDRQTGRAQLGLEPCFEHDDVIEFAEAA
jgi:hypothetical protein